MSHEPKWHYGQLPGLLGEISFDDQQCSVVVAVSPTVNVVYQQRERKTVLNFVQFRFKLETKRVTVNRLSLLMSMTAAAAATAASTPIDVTAAHY